MKEYPIGMRGTIKALPDLHPSVWTRQLVIIGPLGYYFATPMLPDGTRLGGAPYRAYGYRCDVEGAPIPAVLRHEWILPFPPPAEPMPPAIREIFRPNITGIVARHFNCRCVQIPL